MMLGSYIRKTMYKVYRIDLDRGRMVPTTNLRGRAISNDKDYETLSVAPQVSPLPHRCQHHLLFPLAWVVGMAPIILEECMDSSSTINKARVA
jgi:hypothetical protein